MRGDGKGARTLVVQDLEELAAGEEVVGQGDGAVVGGDDVHGPLADAPDPVAELGLLVGVGQGGVGWVLDRPADGQRGGHDGRTNQ